MSMETAFADTSTHAVKYYLSQIGHILEKLPSDGDAARMLAVRLSPDMFDTGFNFAIAIQFAARALCPPAELEVPEIPDEYTYESLMGYKDQISNLIAPISADDVVNRVSHVAGEAELEQGPADYIVRFALPNMIFHMTLAYAGLRHSGLVIGKSDFDGLHSY